MIIKCKMCGGDLNCTEGSTVCECEYCGTTQTVPTADSEKKTSLFNRANRLRLNAEFDKAAAVYEGIVAEFPEEAEAYWGLCLCAYGIEYVDDPATGEKKPTCHRTLPTSIMEDSNFEQACDNADAVARRVYRDEAKAIDRIQKDILRIVSGEKPYDVFICYKETAEEGGRTEDSVLAQEIYDALTEKGLKVFFARISLEDKLGQQYEPYIYAALSSARVMLAVGTKFEYYDAVWVKNEWMRFLSMMRTDRTKTLIPCYKGLDAYDMPREFRQLQAQDMGKLGWLQDLTRGVLKLCGKGEASPAGRPVQQIASGANPTVTSLLQRAFLFLEEGSWDSAGQYFDRVLDAEPQNPMAYIGRMMITLQLRKLEDLDSVQVILSDDADYQKALRFAETDKTYAQTIEKIQKRNDELQKSKDLIKAIRAKDEAETIRLIDAGADVNYAEQGEKCRCPVLIEAIISGNVSIVRRLLEKGANPNCERIFQEGTRYSALRDSIIQWPNDEIANLLIDAGADVNYVEQGRQLKCPVLISAIAEGNVKLVRRLLEKGANPNCERIFKDGQCYSALRDSIAEWPNDEIANLLIDAGADVNYVEQGQQLKCPVLIGAIFKGNVKLVRRLLEKGANPNCERVFKNGQRYSALRDSILQWPNDEIANLLIDAGADVNYVEQGEELKCPVLIDAIVKGNVRLARRLLEKGANPNCERVFKDGQRYSALRDSIIEWPNVEIANLLIDAGADVNYAGQGEKLKCPVLISAIIKGNVKLVRRLLEKGANPNCERIFKDGQRYSALRDSIIEWPNDEIANLLIDAGADVNYVEQGEKLKCPVLIDAIVKGNVKLVRRLLEKGANPNCERVFKDGQKDSALYDSIIQWPNDEIANLLIDAGADVNYADQSEQLSCPVLISAIIKGNVELVRRLLEKGANPNCERVFKDRRRYSALRDSILEWPNLEITRLLVSAGARGSYKSGCSDGRHVSILWEIMKNERAPLAKLYLETRYQYLDALLDAGARFDAEDESIQRIKLDKSRIPKETIAKMKKAGWRPPLF